MKQRGSVQTLLLEEKGRDEVEKNKSFFEKQKHRNRSFSWRRREGMSSITEKNELHSKRKLWRKRINH